MKAIIMCKGLPASGKSTRAKDIVAGVPGKYKRVNKDDLRAMLDISRFSKDNENFVLKTRDGIISSAILGGKSIIVDDTNLDPKHEEHLRKLAKVLNCKFEIKSFVDVPLEECIERDRKRSNSVGEKVIMDMYNRYLYVEPVKPVHDPKLCPAVICDIDGTLAKMGDRSPYDQEKVGLDTVIEPTKYMVNNLYHQGCYVIITTGRMSGCRELTEKRLKDNEILYNELIMREQDDTRKDSIVKEEMYNDWIKGKYNIFCVFDDRPQVVKMRRSLGLYVYDCNQTGRDF